MLGITQYFACHGIAIDAIRGYLRPLGHDEMLLLVGSVAEGLASPESDLDLLLVTDDANVGSGNACEAILRSMPVGFDLNIEVVGHRRVEALGAEFLRSLEIAKSAFPGAPRALPFLGGDELRLLHRLRTGIPLSAPEGAIDALRERHALHALPDLCLLQHAACHLRLRADARQSAFEVADPFTPLLMSQLAMQHLIGAVLASIGESNVNPKWFLRLLRDHRRALQAYDPERLARLALPGTAGDVRAAVESMLSCSSLTLARLAEDAERGGSPAAGMLAALAATAVQAGLPQTMEVAS
jgi:hypothetical protein